MIHARYVAQWCALAREATALESQVPQSLREARSRALRLSQVYDRWWLLDRDNAELWRRAAPDRPELWARAWSVGDPR